MHEPEARPQAPAAEPALKPADRVGAPAVRTERKPGAENRACQSRVCSCCQTRPKPEPVKAEPAKPAAEPAPAAKPHSRLLHPARPVSILSAEEIASREAEERRQAELRARQEALIRERRSARPAAWQPSWPPSKRPRKRPNPKPVAEKPAESRPAKPADGLVRLVRLRQPVRLPVVPVRLRQAHPQGQQPRPAGSGGDDRRGAGGKNPVAAITIAMAARSVAA